jgi:hypothetical protein
MKCYTMVYHVYACYKMLYMNYILFSVFEGELWYNIQTHCAFGSKRIA